MRFVAKVRTTALSVGLVVALTTVFSGCESSDKSTGSKPIESNILNKLSKANQSQSETAKAEKSAQAKKR